MQWNLLETKEILKTIPFSVEELSLQDKSTGKNVHPFYRLKCPDWVNVLPIAATGEAILIRQSRSGSFKVELETPGGVVEESEKDVTMTAARELEEETGFTSQRILPLGAINPNPAIMSNRLHMFVALGCQQPAERKYFPDDNESISVELVPVNTLEELVRSGRINHCLSALTIMLAQQYIKMD